jgi:hypothetical protein
MSEREMTMNELLEHYCVLANLAQNVVDAWQGGDLAQAVRDLDGFLKFLDKPVE